MKSIRRILAAALALLFLLGTVACTTPPTPEDDTRPATEAPTAGETQPATLPATDTPTDPETAPPPVTAERPAQDVRVVSFNLDASEATATARSKLLMPLIKSFEPDSIGVQEARGSWVGILRRQLERDGYVRVGVDAGGNSDATAGWFATYIFYREDRYTLLDSGTFWMSKTPDVPSIYDSTVDCNRTCTWALLENKETGFRYIHMNTHLDWMNMEVNRIQVAMIREQLERFAAMGYPVFATGDYNCDEGTASYHEMLKSDIIADSKHVADKTMDLGTYPSYGKYDVTVTEPIDYVFVTKDMMDVHEYKVIDEKPNGEYVSDHNGLFVHATVKALPAVEEEKTVPQFSADADIRVEQDGAFVLVTIPQATDARGILASGYRLELVGKSGEPVTATVSSGVLTPEPPETVTHYLEGLTNAETYTLRVTPISILGDEGEAGEVTFTYVFSAPDPAEPIPMTSGLLFDLAIVDGAPVDRSENALPFTTVGTPAVEGNELVFSKNGNYKIPGIKDHYSALTDGFTLEARFTTGSDIQTYQNPVANFHAGGFGINVTEGSMVCAIHSGSGYVNLKTDLSPNTTYHVVLTFDAAAKSATLYVNGQYIESAIVEKMKLPTEPSAQYLCIGADSDASGKGEYLFGGRVSLVRLYRDPATDGNALWLWQQLGE